MEMLLCVIMIIKIWKETPATCIPAYPLHRSCHQTHAHSPRLSWPPCHCSNKAAGALFQVLLLSSLSSSSQSPISTTWRFTSSSWSLVGERKTKWGEEFSFGHNILETHLFSFRHYFLLFYLVWLSRWKPFLRKGNILLKIYEIVCM